MSFSAAAARRWMTIIAPLLAGLFLVMGAVADPAPSLQGSELAGAYADAPDRVQWKSFGYHFAFGFMGAMVFLLASRIRRTGAWLANTAVVFSFLGITTLPGFILADFYDSAIGQAVGLDAYAEINAAMEGMWALAVLAGTGGLGMFLSIPLIAGAAWRGRLVPWWGAVVLVAAVAAFAVAANPVGATVSALLFAAFSVVLWRVLARDEDETAGTAEPRRDDARVVADQR
jgi:uncharacterized membrane protein